MKKNLNYILVILLITCFNSGSALECFECDSTNHHECEHPTQGYDIESITTTCADSGIHHPHENNMGLCYKILLKNQNHYEIHRGCGEYTEKKTCDNLKYQLEYGGRTVTYCETCNGDQCNSAPQRSVMLLKMFIVVLILRFI